MIAVRVTDHACQRYAERVEPCSVEEARERILRSERAIRTAMMMKCAVIKLGTGHRLVLDGTAVVTVYSAGVLPRQCRNRPNEEGELF